MRSLILSTAILSTAIFGCGETRSGRNVEVPYLRTVMPDSLLEFSHLEVASEECVKIISEGREPYLGLQIVGGQRKLNNGTRAELSVDYPFQPGDVVRYSWRFMLPADFVSDSPENRWCLIAQWHDQPIASIGESWDTFPSRSPPVMLGLGEVDGKLGFGLTTGPTVKGQEQISKGPVFLARGKWHRIAVAIHWSQGTDGEVRVFLDDSTTPVALITGPNMNNGYQHYMKLGMYRHPEITTSNWVFIDDIEISKEPSP